MKKLLSILLVLAMAAGLSLTAFAATQTMGDTTFTRYVSGSGKWQSKSVKGKGSASYRIYGYTIESQAKEAFRLINNERAAQGLPKLTWEQDLYEPAVQRAYELYVKWSHDRPDGTEFYTVHKLANGENLAAGAIFSAEEVTDGWMNSRDHRTNILEADYNSGAVACVETDQSVYWVQLFHSDKKVSADDPNAKTTTKTTTTAESKDSTDNATGGSSGSGKTVSAKDVTAKLASASKATIKNAETLTPAAIKEIATATAGKEVSVVFTTSFANKSSTQGQMTVNPAALSGMEKNLSLKVSVEGSDVEKVAANFAKWYKNDVAVVQMAAGGTLPATVRVAAKPAALKGMSTGSLEFYSYNASTKKVKLLENTDYTVDKSGFVHFNTNRGDFIIVSDGKLTK